MILSLHKNFEKQLRKLGPDERDRCKEYLSIFRENHRHPLLKNHKLMGDRKGENAIHIGGDLSAIYEVIEGVDGHGIAYFTELGTHHELYGK